MSRLLPTHHSYPGWRNRHLVGYDRLVPDGVAEMHTVRIVYWEDSKNWIGYLQDFPDYWTQGETLDDLKDHLRDLYHDLNSGELPGIRKADDLVVS